MNKIYTMGYNYLATLSGGGPRSVRSKTIDLGTGSILRTNIPWNKERNMAQKKTRATKAKSTAKRKPAAKKAVAAKKPARKVAAKARTTKAKTTAKVVKAKAPARARTSARAKSGEDFQSYSGKFTVRLPKSLHQALVLRAEKEGVSLNLFVTNALSRTVAMPSKKR